MRKFNAYFEAFYTFVYVASFSGYSLLVAISESSWKVFFPVVFVLAVVSAVFVHFLGVVFGILVLFGLWYVGFFLVLLLLGDLFEEAD